MITLPTPTIGVELLQGSGYVIVDLQLTVVSITQHRISVMDHQFIPIKFYILCWDYFSWFCVPTLYYAQIYASTVCASLPHPLWNTKSHCTLIPPAHIFQHISQGSKGVTITHCMLQNLCLETVFVNN